MFVRTTQYVGLTPDRIRPTVDALAERLLPAMEEWGCQDGFVLVNHYAGRVMGITLWETDAQMQASRGHDDRVRSEISWRDEPFVETWEIALDRDELLERLHALPA
jgi:hypothetical protein